MIVPVNGCCSLTGLGQEEQEDELQARRHRTKADHPPPTAVHLLEPSSNGVCDDLSSSDHDDVDDDHASTQTRGGELLDVQRCNACCDAHTDTDQEATTDL